MRPPGEADPYHDCGDENADGERGSGSMQEGSGSARHRYD
jgi:hypothetical protein